MENIIYTDADLNAFLVANEEQTGNTIAIVIDCDITVNQELTITAGAASTTETLTPGTINRVEVPLMLWNFGDDTVITLSKGGTDAGEITIHFPTAVDSDAAINETETDNEFTLQGSASVQDQIDSINESVERVSAQTLAYILPSSINQSGIADGGSNTVETFNIEAGAGNTKVAFFTCIQFLATTTITAANAYEDLSLTITISVDGVAVVTALHTYRDGRQVLTINSLIENLSKGNHTMTVNIAAAGGSISTVQIISAHLLTAKSSSSGTSTTKALFVNGKWGDDILASGLNAEKMTEAAMLNGVEDTIIKYALAASGTPRPVSDLSEFYLSDYVLCNGQHYAEPFYIKDGYYRKQGTHGSSGGSAPTGQTEVFFWIPIKRISGFNKLQYTAKTIATQGSTYNLINCGVGAVINGEMQLVSASHTKNTEWVTYTLDISALPYIDYILLYGCDGSPAYRNIILIKE